eukprot:ANDGO_06088.mRNA.1 hypothetical protein NAEGRDRAFT_58715
MDPQASIYFNEIEYVVRKRTQHLSYLKRLFSLHSSPVGAPIFWMNSCRITPSLLDSLVRSHALSRKWPVWHVMGISLGDLLTDSRMSDVSSLSFLRACVLICEEAEFHIAGSLSQNFKTLRASVLDATSSVSASVSNAFSDSTEVTRASSNSNAAPFQSPSGSEWKAKLQKANGQVVYSVLKAHHVPYSTSPFEAILSLCDVLLLTYRRFLDDASAAFEDSVRGIETIEWMHRVVVFRLDKFYKHHFFGLVSREITRTVLAPSPICGFNKQKIAGDETMAELLASPQSAFDSGWGFKTDLRLITHVAERVCLGESVDAAYAAVSGAEVVTHSIDGDLSGSDDD